VPASKKPNACSPTPPVAKTEVVYESGFESIPHFNRVFNRCTGLPPTAYRAALRR
jgi:methylphosphotriester-DNA--protein-cysteine methyltransferase